jgi:vacuolar-type H+-ATPase subunit C/Vma6
MLAMVRGVSTQYHLESGPLLRYLISLGYEARNMQAIAVGVGDSLSLEEIERVLVLEDMK